MDSNIEEFIVDAHTEYIVGAREGVGASLNSPPAQAAYEASIQQRDNINFLAIINYKMITSCKIISKKAKSVS